MKSYGADLAPMVLRDYFQLEMNYVFGQISFRGVHQLVCLELDLYGGEKTRHFFWRLCDNYFFFLHYLLHKSQYYYSQY